MQCIVPDFFRKSKKSNFLRFFASLHTFSRMVPFVSLRINGNVGIRASENKLLVFYVKL